MAYGLMWHGHGPKIWNEGPNGLYNAFWNGTDDDFSNAIIKFYGTNDRARKHKDFIEQLKTKKQPATFALPPIIEQPVSTRVSKPQIFPSKKQGGCLVSKDTVKRFKYQHRNKSYNKFQSGGKTTKFKTTGGAGYVPPSINSDLAKENMVKASKGIMNWIWHNQKGFSLDLSPLFRNPPEMPELPKVDFDEQRYLTQGTGGTAQDTYLLPRTIQEEEFMKAGYIKGKEGDYGLVKKAVGNRHLPVYQTAPDAIDRDYLIFLGNNSYYSGENGLDHAGSYPVATYTDGHGNFYQKAWDLNDYGGDGGSTAGIAGKLLDFIGSPVVVTTGFQKVPKEYALYLKRDMEKKGLYPIRTTEEEDTDWRYVVDENENLIWALPEVTIAGKQKKKSGGRLPSRNPVERFRQRHHKT